MKTPKKLVVVLGPTASGKTKLSLKLAKEFNGEVVSADSRQVYRGMDIGTSKPDKNEQRSVPHHLLDVVSPEKIFSAGQYQKKALTAINEILKRQRLPFLVGGSPFYVYSVVEGWIFPKMNVDSRRRKWLEKKTAEELFSWLKKLAPKRAKTIETQNKRRLIRAIEIATTLGKVPNLTKKPQFECLLIGIKKTKAGLKKAIAHRTERMIQQGLEEEVRELRRLYGPAVISQTIGYQEVLLYLDGKETKKEAIDKVKLHTMQFARRQMTWFKRDKRIHWVNSLKEAERLVRKFLN